MLVSAAADDAGLSVHAFRVLGRICRRWSERDGCYESSANMARACRMKRDTLYRALGELEARSMIRRTDRPGRSSRIDPTPPSDWTPPAPPNGTGTDPGSGGTPRNGAAPQTGQVPVPPNGAPPVPPNGTLRDPQKESHEGIPSTPTVPKGTGAGGAERFDDFWEAYPKKRARKPCLKKWRAKGLDSMADDLIADVERRKLHDDRWRRDYAPDPLTYLNQERWTDELTDPRPTTGSTDDARNRPVETFQRNASAALAALRPGP